MTANKERGEVEIELGGETYLMRPTFDALCRIEDALGMSIFGFLYRCGLNRAIGVRDIVAIIREGIKGAGLKPPDNDKLGDLIFDAGIEGVSAVAVGFLNVAVLGPKNVAALSDQANEPEKAAARSGGATSESHAAD